MKKLILKLLMLILTVVFLVSGFFVVSGLISNKKTEQLYDKLQSEYVTPMTPPSEEKDEEQSEIDISVDFSTLLNKNSDIVGWLYIPNTVVNYPVVQAENNEKYLRRDLEGKKLTAGTLFADFRCGKIGLDPNYIIFGHNMRNGSMFKTITDYKSQSFYDSNPVLYYLTPNKNYKIEPVLGVVVPDDDVVYDLAFDKTQMVEYINSKKDKSTFSSSVTFSVEDSFITLSTCSKEYENARFVLIGKITEVK